MHEFGFFFRGDRIQETRDKRQETRDKRQEAGRRTRDSGDEDG